MRDSLAKDVAAFVTEHGNTTVDDAMRRWPQKTRPQVTMALRHAASAGAIRLISHGSNRGRNAQVLAVWGKAVEAQEKRPVSFVFDLARLST